jgi:hypothetical protein
VFLITVAVLGLNILARVLTRNRNKPRKIYALHISRQSPRENAKITVT